MAFWNRKSGGDDQNRNSGADAKQRSREDTAKRQQEQLESIAALEGGGIPVQAERRLREQAQDAGFFTSDLSTGEHLLVRAAGYVPLGQVMGTSFFRIGFLRTVGQSYQPTGELSYYTEAQRSARALAVDRLKKEAELLGADGVVGVRLLRGSRDFSGRVIEFTAIGTAITVTGGSARGGSEPFTGALSGQDFWKLFGAGFMPRELAYGVCSYYIHSDQQVLSTANFSRLGMMNQEMVQYTAGFQQARHLAMRRFTEEVRRSGAQGAVGVAVAWDCEEIEYEINDTKYVDLLVHFSALGSGIVARSDVKPGESPANTLAVLDLRDGSFAPLSSEE